MPAKAQRVDKDRDNLGPNQIIVAKGTDHERILDIQRPRGRSNRRLIARHMDKIALLSQFQGAEDQFAVMANVSKRLWEDEEFESEFLPTVLGLSDKDGRAYLDKLDVMETFQAFVEAIGIIMSPETTEVLNEAQKK